MIHSGTPVVSSNISIALRTISRSFSNVSILRASSNPTKRVMNCSSPDPSSVLSSMAETYDHMSLMPPKLAPSRRACWRYLHQRKACGHSVAASIRAEPASLRWCHRSHSSIWSPLCIYRIRRINAGRPVCWLGPRCYHVDPESDPCDKLASG